MNGEIEWLGGQHKAVSAGAKRGRDREGERQCWKEKAMKWIKQRDRTGRGHNRWQSQGPLTNGAWSQYCDTVTANKLPALPQRGHPLCSIITVAQTPFAREKLKALRRPREATKGTIEVRLAPPQNPRSNVFKSLHDVPRSVLCPFELLVKFLYFTSLSVNSFKIKKKIQLREE